MSCGSEWPYFFTDTDCQARGRHWQEQSGMLCAELQPAANSKQTEHGFKNLKCGTFRSEDICGLRSQLNCSSLKQINQHALNATSPHANALMY